MYAIESQVTFSNRLQLMVRSYKKPAARPSSPKSPQSLCFNVARLTPPVKVLIGASVAAVVDLWLVVLPAVLPPGVKVAMARLEVIVYNSGPDTATVFVPEVAISLSLVVADVASVGVLQQLSFTVLM